MTDEEPASGRCQATADDGEPRRFDVDTLLGSRREAVLVHNGEDYRLRITARGRLILTK